MKVKIEIEFEVPGEFSKFSNTELREAFWKEFLHYAVVGHLADAVRWAVNRMSNSDKISENHKLWGNLLDKGKITNFKVTN